MFNLRKGGKYSAKYKVRRQFSCLVIFLYVLIQHFILFTLFLSLSLSLSLRSFFRFLSLLFSLPSPLSALFYVFYELRPLFLLFSLIFFMFSQFFQRLSHFSSELRKIPNFAFAKSLNFTILKI